MNIIQNFSQQFRSPAGTYFLGEVRDIMKEEGAYVLNGPNLDAKPYANLSTGLVDVELIFDEGMTIAKFHGSRENQTEFIDKIINRLGQNYAPRNKN